LLRRFELEERVGVKAEEIAEAIWRRLGRIRISIDYVVFIQALFDLGIARPATSTRSLSLAPNSTIEIVESAPPGYVAVLGESRFSVDPDHSLALYAYVKIPGVDEEILAFYDDDMVQAKYIHPINYLMIGTLLPSERGRFIVVNKTASTAYFSHTTVYAIISKKMWEITVRAVSRVICEEFKLPPEACVREIK
jgi:hypothetical protein